MAGFGPERWGTQPVSEPILSLRWDESDDPSDTRQLRGRRSGRVQNLQEASVSEKYGRAHHRIEPDTPEKRPRMAQEGFLTGAGSPRLPESLTVPETPQRAGVIPSISPQNDPGDVSCSGWVGDGQGF